MRDKDLLSILKDESKVVLVGFDIVASYIEQLLGANLPQLEIAYCDTSIYKQGVYEHRKITNADEAIVSHGNDCFYLLTMRKFERVKQQFHLRGIPLEKILSVLTDEVEEYLKKKNEIHYVEKDSFRKLDKIQFEIDITEHCNLNCKSCTQFSSISPAGFIDIDEMEKDLNRLGEVFAGVCERIYLIGGEPLLHPEIEKCIRIARNAFPVGDISVFTNGALLKTMKESFWNICNDMGVNIIVTKYPIGIDYDELIRIADGYGVSISFFNDPDWYKFMTSIGLDINGLQDVKQSFERCWEANNCIKLKHGRLFTCTRPAAISKFNAYFDKNLIVDSKDSIDIYQEHNADEVLEFLSHPIPFCRYCDFSSRRRKSLWGVTKGNIEEWIV